MLSSAVDEVIRLFNTYGDENYLGEMVSKTQHMIQCARLAEKERYDTQVVVGALLHDIGHLVGIDKDTDSMVTDDIDLGAKDHDTVGGDYLQDLGYPSLVCDVVRGHVKAKRYLVYKDSDYYNNLSSASKMTLEHQGGAMTEQEAGQFEKSSLFELFINMRKWDELAKDQDAPTGCIEEYRPMLLQVLNIH